MRLPNEKHSHDVVAAAIEVLDVLGEGFMDDIYEEALCVELGLRGIKYERDREVTIRYHEHEVGRHRLRLVVGDAVLVEVHAVRRLDELHVAVARSHLRALDRPYALVLNFGKKLVEVRRITVAESKPISTIDILHPPPGAVNTCLPPERRFEARLPPDDHW